MTTLNFLKDHVRSEMESSKEYITKALELKNSHPRISRLLMYMSEQELENAEKLQTMMSEYDAEQTKLPGTHYSTSDYDNAYSDAVKEYTEHVNNIKAMREIYRKS